MEKCKKHNEEFVLVGKHQRKKCRSCNREYQAKWISDNRERHRERVRKSLSIKRKNNTILYLSLFEKKSCIDCGESRIPTLDFDHIDPSTKKFNISQGFRLNYSWEDILEEVDKCEIRCANCHRIKTSIDNNWYI